MTIAADIGGTHARFAVIENGYLHHPQKRAVAQFATLADGLADYCRGVGKTPGGILLIGTAARQDENDVWRFHNGNPWVIERPRLKEAGWQVAVLINDFAASAHGAVYLQAPDGLTTLKDGPGKTGDARAILGPGTGLGLALLIPKGTDWIVQETFGGHMLAAARTDEQFAILKQVRQLRGGDFDVVPEDLASGRGLPVLYRALCAQAGQTPQFKTTDEFLSNAHDPMIKDALRLFHEFLGLFAHNTAVTAHAFDGLYLDGGIIQRLYDAKLYDAASFNKFFSLSMVPSVKAALSATPVWLVRDQFVALRGLAALWSEQHHG